MEFKVGEVYEIYKESGYWLPRAVGLRLRIINIDDNTLNFEWLHTGKTTRISTKYARHTFRSINIICYPDE